MKVERVTHEAIDDLLRFLSLFDAPARAFVLRWAGGKRTDKGAITVPYPIYAADVLEFFRLAGQPCWRDARYEPAEARRMLEVTKSVEKASLAQIKTMLTYCVRGERFCDGHWDSMLRSGRITAILRRLAVLRDFV